MDAVHRSTAHRPAGDPEPSASRGVSESSPPPSAQAARAHFDRWARAYGRSRLLKSRQAKAITELAPRSDDRVLDVACGTGDLLGEIAAGVERAVGLDQSEGMLQIARSRLDAAAGGESSKVELRLGSSDALPFASGEFTAVVCTTALHHFPDPQQSVREMARVLAPGGRVVLGDMARDAITTKLADPLFRRFEAGHVGLQRKRDIEAMMRAAGLQVTNSRHHWIRLYAFVSAERRGG